MILVAYACNLWVAYWNLCRATIGEYQPRPGMGYVLAWWYCVDCLLNAIAFGDPDESISSRAGKARANGRKWACVLCAVLNYFATLIAGKQTDHCAESVEANEGSRAIIPDGE